MRNRQKMIFCLSSLELSGLNFLAMHLYKKSLFEAILKVAFSFQSQAGQFFSTRIERYSISCAYEGKTLYIILVLSLSWSYVYFPLVKLLIRFGISALSWALELDISSLLNLVHYSSGRNSTDLSLVF